MKQPRTMSAHRQLAHAIRKRRLFKRWSQAKLAQEIGSSQSVIARLEAGQGNPTLGLIERISDALDVSFHLIIEPQREEEPTPPEWLSA